MPCGAGVVREHDGTTVVPGKRIFEVAVGGERVLAVAGEFKLQQVDYDPNDPSKRDVLLPFGQLLVATPGAAASGASFPIPSYSTTFEIPNFGRRQVIATPVDVAAYSLTLTPDGSDVVMTTRIHYTVSGHFETKRFGVLDSYCDLAAARDLYHVTQIGIATGGIGYQSATGIGESVKCHTQCFDCPFGLCRPNNYPPAPSCSFSDGFAPGGVSILLGDQ